jgi:hypothetical protein
LYFILTHIISKFSNLGGGQRVVREKKLSDHLLGLAITGLKAKGGQVVRENQRLCQNYKIKKMKIEKIIF